MHSLAGSGRVCLQGQQYCKAGERGAKGRGEGVPVWGLLREWGKQRGRGRGL